MLFVLGTILDAQHGLLRTFYKSYYIFLHIRLFCVCAMCGCACPRCACGGQSTSSKSWLSHSARWVLGLELRSSCLAASAATHGATSLLRRSVLYSGLPSDSWQMKMAWNSGYLPCFSRAGITSTGQRSESGHCTTQEDTPPTGPHPSSAFAAAVMFSMHVVCLYAHVCIRVRYLYRKLKLLSQKTQLNHYMKMNIKKLIKKSTVLCQSINLFDTLKTLKTKISLDIDSLYLHIFAWMFTETL